MDSPTSLIRVLLRSDTDAIPRFTIDCRTLPQEAMPVELQAKGVTAQTPATISTGAPSGM